MTDVIMPQMGESIAEGTITKWMKKVGDRVDRDEPLFEISTDKVDAEIPSPAAGVLTEVRFEPGSTVPINTVVAIIGEAAAAGAPAPAPAASAPAPAPPAAPPSAAAVTPPQPTPTPPAPPPPPAPPTAAPPGPEPAAAPRPSSSSADTVRFQEIPAPEASPAPAAGGTTPAPAPPPARAAAETRATAPEAPRAAEPPPAAVSGVPSLAEASVDELRRTRSSPVVRKIAAEHQVDLSEIQGTGIAGRVTKQDILSHVEAKQAAPPDRPETAAPTPLVPAYRPGERVQVVPMSAIRKKTAEHMTLSKRISAHVTTVFEIDMTRTDQLRQKYRKTYEEQGGVKLTYMPFVCKATVDALKAFPVLNSSVDGDSIVYKKDVNLGIAVALELGLIVPVIHNADEKSVLGLARAVNDLAERARAKKLKVEEVQGGTFTLTNPGVFGSLFGTPIISQPQVAILGVGAIEKRTVVRDDAIAIRTMAYFSLTFDHRIVDGSDADRFMAQIKTSLQEFDETGL
jgi:pyruvate dehydrogenase E2 component (dihydrolipoyllysine-residue acetyltransferase)